MDPAQLALLAAAESKKKGQDAASAAISAARSRAESAGRTGDKNINIDLGVLAKPGNLVTIGVVFVILAVGFFLWNRYGG